MIAADHDWHELRLDGADGPNGGFDLGVGDRDIREMAADITQVARAQVPDVGIPVWRVGGVVAEGEADSLGRAVGGGGIDRGAGEGSPTTPRPMALRHPTA